MAIAVSLVEARPDLGRMTTDITLDGSYAAGGYTLTNAQLGMAATPTHATTTYTHATATSSNVAVYNPATGKLLVFESGTGASAPLVECVAGDITSSHTVRVTAYGTPRL